MSAITADFSFLVMHYVVFFAARAWRDAEGDWGEDRGSGGSSMGGLRRPAGGKGALWLRAERHDRTRQLVCEACKERTSKALQEM